LKRARGGRWKGELERGGRGGASGLGREECVGGGGGDGGEAALA
jgi:hypothetical protein